jgi:hypothetical protein
MHRASATQNMYIYDVTPKKPRNLFHDYRYAGVSQLTPAEAVEELRPGFRSASLVEPSG